MRTAVTGAKITDVSEETISSIFRVDSCVKQTIIKKKYYLVCCENLRSDEERRSFL
jgi:hypothetical protein